MDYSRHYNLLIERSKNRIPDSKTETHHIIPRCMNGTNDSTNLVELTPEEHFLAHLLLMKIYPANRSLVFAAHMMGATRHNNKVYGWLKKQYINSCTGIPKSEEHKKNLRKPKKNYISKKGIPTGRKTKGSTGMIPWNKGKEHMVGENNPAFGKLWNDEKRNKMSSTNKGRKRVHREDGTFYYIYPHLENKVRG
jgi:hypothetical protein